MPKNMGFLDRRVRLGLAVVFALVVVFVTDGALDWVFGVLAVVMLATSVVGTCPLYLPFGIDTHTREA